MTVTTERDSGGDSRPRPALIWRIVLSIGLSAHVLTVFVGPFTFATSSGPGMASPFVEPLRAALRPYLELAFLDHGYFFFAPNPGPSHLLRAQLEFADGRPSTEIVLPDRARHWPRLLYHRHFMLAEQFHAGFVPAEPPPEVAADPGQYANWQSARAMYVLRRASLEAHLRHAWGASRVTLTRVEHSLPAPAEFAEQRRSLNAPETYVDLPETPAPPPAIGPGGRP